MSRRARPTECVAWLGLASVLALGAAISGCATQTGRTPRSYLRSHQDEVPLARVDVIALSASRHPLDDARLDVEVFPPPDREARLAEDRLVDPVESEALSRAIVVQLEEQGFETRVLDVETLEEALTATGSGDATLVVRAVPVEPLFLLEDVDGGQVIDPGSADANLQVQPGLGLARATAGRIYVGQAFLYTRPNGVRLWSEQLPDFPRDGFLRRDGALLGQGAVGSAAANRPVAAMRASARDAFLTRLLQKFPTPRAGTESGRIAIGSLDAAAEDRRQSFLDASHLSIEVGTGWSFELLESEVALADGTTLPSLGSAELAPNGGLAAVELRFRWVLPEGTSFAAGGWWGVIPGGGIERSVFRGGEVEREDDILGPLRITGETLFGGTLGVGRVIFLGTSWLLEPSVHALVERWEFSASPAAAFSPSSHTRLGIEGRLDLMWLVGGGPFMIRVGGEAKGGLDIDGQLFAGFGASTGLGLFF